MLAYKEPAKIFLGTIFWSIVLGLAIDVVTANVAVDYFAKYHPHVVDSRSPWVMAGIWGVGASWWAGAIAGAVLAFVNLRLKPPVPSNVVLRWVRNSCGVIWCVMMVIVLAVYCLAALISMQQRRPTFEYDRRLVAVAVAHAGEYLFAAIAMVVIILIMRSYSKGRAA